jgi:hypothetical protein
MGLRILSAMLPLVFLASSAAADTAKTDPSEAEIAKIIKTFAENEAAFAKARENYTYRQTVKLQEFDNAGTAHGRFERVEDIIFDRDNKRTERVVRAPMPNLRLIQMSAEDEQDLRNVMPFVLTSNDVGNYHVRYLGRQMADEIGCYVFAVKPKTMEPGKRYFQGQIWVDDRDLMIVKTYGRSAGILKKSNNPQQFAKFETYREQIDGKYWFPTYTAANSTLHFTEQEVGVKMTVKYEDYKQFKSDVKITFGEEAKPEDIKPENKPESTPEPKPKQ